MGWSESHAGLSGDEPADAFGEAIHAIQSSALPLPSAEELIASLIAAMNCDGQREQLFQGKHLVAAFEIQHGDVAVRISDEAARSDVVRLMYQALDAASEGYRESFGRPPTIAEILQYLEMYLEPEHGDGFVSNPGQWRLRNAVVVRFKKVKPADRLPCPIDEPTAASPMRKVHHRKFGAGVIARDLGATVEVLFDDGQRRVIQRTFLVPEGPRDRDGPPPNNGLQQTRPSLRAGARS